MAAGRLPHSRHKRLDRSVINPQNGHTLCDPKPRLRAFRAANCAASTSMRERTRIRARSRKRRKVMAPSNRIVVFAKGTSQRLVLRVCAFCRFGLLGAISDSLEIVAATGELKLVVERRRTAQSRVVTGAGPPNVLPLIPS